MVNHSLPKLSAEQAQSARKALSQTMDPERGVNINSEPLAE